MSEHTPSPWRAMQRPHTKGPPSTAPEDAHLDYFHIQAGEVGADGWEMSGYMRPADAHLIAAAPELLTAARFVLNYIKNEEGGLGLTLKSGDLLRAAIAKAEGQS